MNIKNLEVNKRVLICTGSWLVLTPALITSYEGTSGIKFISNDDTYEVHRIDMTEYSKDGILENDKYLSERPDCDDYIILKRPYEENNNKIQREVIGINTSSYSQVEINYILHNLDNQTLLLSQDYIQDIIDKGDNFYSEGENPYTYYEYTSAIPDDNNYEISYMTIDGEDKNDTKNIKYTKTNKVIRNSLGLMIYSITSLQAGALVYFSSKLISKDKVKTKKK